MTKNKTNNELEEIPSVGQRIWSEVKFFAGLSCVMLAFLTFIWGHYKIPSESMLPTLEVGDHLYVSKYAYGFSRHSPPFGLHKLPFLKEGKVFSKLPKRGDVIVFRNPKDEKWVLIKRAVGLPGDKIRVYHGRLFINDVIVPRDPIDNFLYREHLGDVQGVDVYKEQWPGEEDSHLIYEQTDAGLLDNAGEFIVPPDTIFFMGDNRDNSADSRDIKGPGFVPLSYLIGRAEFMMFSFKRCKTEINDQGKEYRCPAKRRFMLRL